jgi:hypothetical protein
MNEERRLQIYTYLKAYFDIIREFLQTEPQYQQFVPQLFKFPYLFLVCECTDGYVVAAYPSGFADNYIYFEKNDTVDNAMRSFPNLVAGTANHVVLGIDGFGGSGMIQGILDRVETSRGPVPTTGWKFLYMATTDFDWPAVEARKDAHETVATLKARAAVYKPSDSALLMSYDSALLRRETISRLYEILEQYRSIVDKKHFEERVIHRFLRDNNVMLFPTKKQMVYEYPLKEGEQIRYKIDFVIEITTGRYVLVELENPRHKLFTAAGDFRQIVNHASQQVANWILWIRNHPDNVRTDFPGIIAPEGLIVIGRNSDLNNEQREKIRLRNEHQHIKLMTYDDLAEEAENHIKHILDV